MNSFNDENGRFSVILHSNALPEHSMEGYDLNDWANGKFTTFLPNPLLLDTNARYRVCLEEISFDFAPVNVSRQQVFYWNSNLGIWDSFAIEPQGTYTSLSTLINVLNLCRPRELQQKLQFQRNTVNSRIDMQINGLEKVQLSDDLARILGFYSNYDYGRGVNTGYRMPDVFRNCGYFLLTCPTLVEYTYVGTQALPVLRSFGLGNKNELKNSSRVCLQFDKLRWLPLRLNYINRVELQFLDAVSLKPVAFSPSTDPCIVTLGFKQANIVFR